MLGLGLGVDRGGFVPSLPLLDVYGGAAAAYSLRKLRTAYTGAAIRVRESATNTEADIGFTSSGELDTTALLAHTGANDGFVVTWYDQAGSNSVTQASAAAQPQIVSSGSVILENSQPTIYFDNNALLQKTTITPFSQYSLFSIFTIQTLNEFNFGIVGSFSLSTGDAWGVRPTLKLYDYDGGIYTATGDNSVTLGSQLLFTSILTTTEKNIYKNSTLSATGTGTSISSDDIIIGNNGLGGTFDALKNIQSVILYPSDQSSNRTAIESNINAFYNIYP